MSDWSPPQTWASVVVTVPDMNREVRDNLTALHGTIISSALNYTVADSDGHNVTVLVDATAGVRIIGLATAISKSGAVVTIKKIDSSVNTVTIDGSGVQSLDGAATWILTGQWESLTLQSNGSDWVVLGWRRPLVITTQSAIYTATTADDVILVPSGTFTLTLHPVAQDRHGRSLTVKLISGGSGLVTVDGDGAELIDDDPSILLYPGDALTLLPIATGWIIV